MSCFSGAKDSLGIVSVKTLMTLHWSVHHLRSAPTFKELQNSVVFRIYMGTAGVISRF